MNNHIYTWHWRPRPMVTVGDDHISLASYKMVCHRISNTELKHNGNNFIVTPCVHWRVQNNILKTGRYFIYRGWCLCKTGGGDDAGGAATARPHHRFLRRAECRVSWHGRSVPSSPHTHTADSLARPGSFLRSRPARLGSLPPGLVAARRSVRCGGISTSVKEGDAALHSDYCLLCTHLSVDQVTTTSKKSSAARCHKLLSKKLDRIKWLQHKIGCNNIHIPVLPDDWCSINISIHLNILVPSLHP